MNAKFQRKVRRLMILGLPRREAEARAAHLQIKDWDEQARNAEFVPLFHSKELKKNVSIPS